MKTIFIVVCTVLFTTWARLDAQPAKFEDGSDPVLPYLIHGNHFFSESKLLEFLPTFTRKNFQSTVLSSQIIEFYRQAGFFFARVDSIRLNSIHIEIFLTENDQIKIDSVIVTESKIGNVQSEISKWVTRPNQIFSPAILENDIEGLVDWYGDQGYPFASAEVENLEFIPPEAPKRVKIYIKIGEKEFVRISKVLVKGNSFTRSSVIQREMRIEENEIFRNTKLAQIKRRLERLGYFKLVQEPELISLDQGRWGLLQRIEEGNTSSFDGVVGYVPDRGAQKGFFTGLLDLTVKNFLGTGRRINVFWEKRNALTQELRLHYEEPWIFHFPFQAGVGFEQLNQDSSYVRRMFTLEGTYPATENLSLFGKYSSTEVIPDSGLALSLGIPSSQTQSIGLGGEIDLRDEPLNPRTGSYYRTSFEFGFKSISGPDTLVHRNSLDKHVQNQKIIFDVETYFPVRPRQILALTFHGAEIRSNENVIPISDQFLFGGARTVRGYRENQFHASRVIWLKTEYRFLLSKRSRFFLFIDAAYYNRKEERNPGSDKRVEDQLLGSGFGIRVETRLGLMGIDYGLGRGDVISTGKIHISISNEF